MATKSGITTARTAEIIPSLELPEFNKAVKTLEDVEVYLEPISREARALEINSAADFARAGELIARLKDANRDGENTMAPYKAKVKLVSDFIRTRILRVANKVEETKDVLTGKMSEWTRKEEQAAAAEQAHLQKLQADKLRREAEEKRRADEEAAAERRRIEVAKIQADLKAGEVGKREAERLKKEAEAQASIDKQKAKETAQFAKDNAVAEASKLTVAANVPTVAGVVKRVNYKFRIIDETKIPRGFLSPDEVKIGAYVRATKKTGEVIPGIEVYEDRSF